MNNYNYLQKQASIILNLFNSKNYDDVITRCKTLIKKYPDQVMFYNAAALSYASLNNNLEGINILNQALKIYKDVKKVWHINGYNYPNQSNLYQDTFFTRSMEAWGWATWKRAWLKFDNNFDALVKELIYLGDHIRTRLEICGNDQFIVKVPNSHMGLKLTEGSPVKVSWKTEDSRALETK